MCWRRDEGRPRWVSGGLVVAVRIGGANGGDWAPEVVSVLGVEAGDDAIGGRHVEQREEPGVLRQVIVVRGGGESGDQVPGQIRVFNPELGRLGLVSIARGAVDCTQALNFVKVSRVVAAIEFGRTFGQKLRTAP